MKAATILSVCLLAIGAAAWAVPASADSTSATCGVRKDGEKQKGRSGACTFSQRQGYININLKNGDSISLSPAGNADRYRDQNGNKVVRTTTGTTGMTFKWEGGKRIDVTWTGNTYGGPPYGSGGKSGSEYQRGYDDGQRGNWDQNKHNQEYKDGYRAGEAARGGGGYGAGNKSGHSSSDYGINRLDNGSFEVVWSKPFCSVLIAPDGRISKTSQGCTDHQIDRSREIGRRER